MVSITFRKHFTAGTASCNWTGWDGRGSNVKISRRSPSGDES